MAKNDDPLNQSPRLAEIDKRLGEIRDEQNLVAEAKTRESQVSSVRSRLGRGAVSGLTQAVAGIPQGLAVMQGAFDDVPLQERGLYQAGEKLQKYVDEDVLELTPEEQNTFVTQVGKGLGQVAGLAVPGGLAGKAGTAGKALGFGVSATAGSGMSAHEGVQDYIATREKQGKAIDPQELEDVAFYNSLRGLTELIPVSRFVKTGRGLGGSIVSSTEKGGLRSIQRGAKKSGAAKLAQVAGEGAKGLTLEGAQEAFDQLALNAIAKGLVKYDTERGLFTDVRESAEVGGTVGGIFNAAMGALGLRARGRYEQAVQNTVDQGVIKAREENLEKAINPETGQEFSVTDINKIAKRINTFQNLRNEAEIRAEGPRGGETGQAGILDRYDSRINELVNSLEKKYITPKSPDGKPKEVDPVAQQEAKALVDSLRGEGYSDSLINPIERKESKASEKKAPPVEEEGGQLSLFNDDDTPSKNFLEWMDENNISPIAVERMRSADEGSLSNGIFKAIESAYINKENWSEADISPEAKAASQDPEVLTRIERLMRANGDTETEVDAEVADTQEPLDLKQEENEKEETVLPPISDTPTDELSPEPSQEEVPVDEVEDTLAEDEVVSQREDDYAAAVSERAKAVVEAEKPTPTEEAIEEAPAVKKDSDLSPEELQQKIDTLQDKFDKSNNAVTLTVLGGQISALKELARSKSLSSPLGTDLTKKGGEPFAKATGAKAAATRAKKKTGGEYEVVEVAGGFVARPIEQAPAPKASKEGNAATLSNITDIESITPEQAQLVLKSGIDFPENITSALEKKVNDAGLTTEVEEVKADLEDSDKGGYVAPQEDPTTTRDDPVDVVADAVAESEPTVEEMDTSSQERIDEIEAELLSIEEKYIEYEIEGKNPQALQAKERKLRKEKGALQKQISREQAREEEQEAIRIAREEGGIDDIDEDYQESVVSAISKAFSLAKDGDHFVYHNISNEQITANREATERLASRIKIPKSELRILYVDRLEDIKDKALLNSLMKRYGSRRSVEQGIPNAIIHKPKNKKAPMDVYIIGRANRTVKSVENAILHEVIGHFGMSKLFGESWNNFLQKSIRNTPKLFQTAYDRVVGVRGYVHLSDLSPKKGQSTTTVFLNGRRQSIDTKVAMLILDEYIAMEAETLHNKETVKQHASKRGFFNRLIAWVRHKLRSFNIGTERREYKLTDNDIIGLLTEVHAKTFEDSPYATGSIRDFQSRMATKTGVPNALQIMTDKEGSPYYIDETNEVNYLNDEDAARVNDKPSVSEFASSVEKATLFITKSLSRLGKKQIVKKAAIRNILNQKDISNVDRDLVNRILDLDDKPTINKWDLLRLVDATMVKLSFQETTQYSEVGVIDTFQLDPSDETIYTVQRADHFIAELRDEIAYYMDRGHTESDELIINLRKSLDYFSKFPSAKSIILNAPFKTPYNNHFPMAAAYVGHYRRADLGDSRYILEFQSDLAQYKEFKPFKNEEEAEKAKEVIKEYTEMVKRLEAFATSHQWNVDFKEDQVNEIEKIFNDLPQSLQDYFTFILEGPFDRNSKEYLNSFVNGFIIYLKDDIDTLSLKAQASEIDSRWYNQLKPYIHERLMREAIYTAKLEGKEKLYFPTADTLITTESWESVSPEKFISDYGSMDYNPGINRVIKYLRSNKIERVPFSSNQATVWLKYAVDYPKIYRDSFGVDTSNVITDEHGNTWYEVNLDNEAVTIESEEADMVIMASQEAYQKADTSKVGLNPNDAYLKMNWWQQKADRVMKRLKYSKTLNYFTAMGNMPSERQYDNIGLNAKGLISKGDIQIRHLKRLFKKHQDPKTKAAIYKYFTTRDADIEEISALNANEKAMISKAKGTIEQLGEEFVKLGILSRDIYEKNKGAYLPIRYFQYINSYPGGGKRPSFMNYLKKQNPDITKADKVAMGRIQDPEFLVIETVATMSRDAALLNMFKNISSTSKKEKLFWILDDEVYTQVGRHRVPLADIDDTINHYEQLISDGIGNVYNFTESDIKILEAYRDTAILAKRDGEDALRDSVREAMESEGKEYSEDLYKTYLQQNYVKMPNDYVYGALRNRWVRKEIYQDITDSYEHNQVDPNSVISKWLAPGGYVETAHQFWKMMKVPFNIPSWFRNGIGNAVLLDISTHTNSIKLGKMINDSFWTALKGDPYLYKNSPKKGTKEDNYRYMRIAIEKGLFGTTFSTQELYLTQQTTIDEAKRRIARAAIKDKKTNWLKGNMQQSMWWAQEKFFVMSEMANQLYGGLEGIFKSVALQDYIETWEAQNGKSLDDVSPEVKQGIIDEAARHANEAIFDYSKIPNFLRVMRRYPLGAPFLTFTYKSLGAVTRGMAYNPQKFIKYAALPYIMAQAFLMNNDLDEDDLEEIKQKYPLWMKDKMSVYILPWKDNNGNWQAMDFGYFFPWEIWQNYGLYVKNHFDTTRPGMSSLEMIGEVPKQLGFASGPMPSMLTAFFNNKDDFTGREIITTGAPESQQLNELMGYLYTMWMPTFVTQHGFLGKMMDEFGIEKTPFNSGRELNRYGDDRGTLGQAASRLVGLNVHSIDPDTTHRQNLAYFKSQLSKLKAARSKTLKDRNLDMQSKTRLLKEHNERIKQLRTKQRKYLEGE